MTEQESGVRGQESEEETAPRMEDIHPRMTAGEDRKSVV